MSQPTRQPVAENSSESRRQRETHSQWAMLGGMILTARGADRDGAIPHAGEGRDPYVFLVIEH